MITCYDQKYSYDKQRNSRIYLYDSLTGNSKGYIILNTCSHVGGISFDKKNGILYISNYNGKTITFDLNPQNIILIEKILDNNTIIDLSDEDIDKKYNMTIDNDISVTDVTDCGRNSTMYACGDYVYVATFNEDESSFGEVVKFKINNISDGYYKNDGEVDVWYNKELSSSIVYKRVIPDYTQGVLRTTYKKDSYIITSQSFSNAKSILTVYREDDDSFTYLGSNVIDHPGVESLHIDDNGKIICVFENGSCDLYETDMEKLLKSFDSNKEVLDARVEQEIYNSIDQAYRKYQEDKKYYSLEDFNLSDIWDVICEEGFLDFLIGIFKGIPESYRHLIEINEDFIEMIINSCKVIPREFKLKLKK